MTKQPTNASSGPAPQGDGAPNKLVTVAVGDRGVAVYPGQSGEDVMVIAKIIDDQFDVGIYVAQDIARRILIAIARRPDSLG